MENVEVILNKANKFLENHTFEIEKLFGIDFLSLDVKVKLLNIKNYISVGEDTPHIQYVLYLIKSNNELVDNFLNPSFDEGKEIPLNTSNDAFYLIRLRVDSLLKNFLKYFGLEYSTICVKIVNHLNKQTNIKESLINEGVYDLAVRQVVKDIVSLFKYQRDGQFELPSDLYDKDYYSFPKLPTEFGVELILTQDENVYPYELDANYYRDEDIIEVSIVSSPDIMDISLSEFIRDLNELIRHEFEHMSQYYRGYKFPNDPDNNFKYYTQKHEIEAQLAGFRRRAKKEKRTIEDVAREWFSKNQSKHGLNQKEIEKVIKKIISLKSNGR